MTKELWAISGAIGLCAALGWTIYIYVSRSQYLLAKWAEDNGYQLLNAEFRPFIKGPFFWSSKGQTVYRVTICDEQGNHQSGWVRCGHPLLGLFADQIEAKLDG